MYLTYESSTDAVINKVMIPREGSKISSGKSKLEETNTMGSEKSCITVESTSKYDNKALRELEGTIMVSGIPIGVEDNSEETRLCTEAS